jgi:hypothetical protein
MAVVQNAINPEHCQQEGSGGEGRQDECLETLGRERISQLGIERFDARDGNV